MSDFDPHRAGRELGEALGRLLPQLPEGRMSRAQEAMALRGAAEGLRAVCEPGASASVDALVDFVAASLRQMWRAPGTPVDEVLGAGALVIPVRAPAAAIAQHLRDIVEHVLSGRTFEGEDWQRLVDAAARLEGAVGLPVDSDDPRYDVFPARPCVGCGHKTRGLSLAAWEGHAVPPSWCSDGRIWICYRSRCLQALDDAIDFAEGTKT